MIQAKAVFLQIARTESLPLGLSKPMPPAPPAGAFKGLLRQCLIALLFVAIATLVAEVLFRSFGLTRLSPVFLTPVLICGVTLGARPAIFAAFLSFSVFNVYLVEPRFEWRLADAEDYMTLGVFLIAALLTGGLSGRLRDQTYRILRQVSGRAALLRASRALSVATEEGGILLATRAGIAEISALPAAVWKTEGGDFADLGEAGKRAADDIAGLVRDALDQGRVETVSRGEWRCRTLRVDEQAIAVAVWRRPGDRAASDNEKLIEVLIDLGAATIARVRLTAAGAETAALARMEKLRTALLSSLSHDFRTPLSGILASASTLAEYGDKLPSEDRRDLALNIQQEAQTLSEFVASLLSMTRLESGAVALELSRVRPSELVHEIAEKLERRHGSRRIVSRELAGETYAAGDPMLLTQALTNVLENALHFSPAQSPIEVEVRATDARVEISVADAGPGVPEEDLGRIFDKFYRVVSDQASAGGLGLGLSIARGLIEAMEGAIRAENRMPGPGLVISMTLPRANDAGI